MRGKGGVFITPAVTRGSVYGLALRVNRNCSTAEAADLRYEELAARLRQREYPETVIAAGIARARAVPRLEALQKVERVEGGGGRQHRLITEYDRRSSPALAGVLKSNYEQMVARDRRLGRTFPNPPRPGFKRGKNVKELLCRARLPPARGGMNTRAATAGREVRNSLTRCNKGLNRNGCGACPHITSRPSEVIK